MFYDLRNEAVINTLLPTVTLEAKLLLAECERQGIWILLTQGYRSFLGQTWDYASGRYRPGPIITDAKPGWSFHQWRVAIDFVPADGNGGIHYEDAARIQQVADIAKSQGWQWGGDFPRVFKDRPHLQFTGGHPIEYFRAGGTI